MSPIDVAFVDTAPTGMRAEVRMDDDTHQVSFEASVPLFGERADALVPLAVLAGMRRRQPIRVHGKVSEQLLDTVVRAQEILCSFLDGASAVAPIVADPVPVTAPAGAGRACFFSGGVDSFDSALRHRSALTHLVYVQGFDVRVDGTKRAGAGRRAVRAAADELGLPLVEVATNLRVATDPYAPWSMAHGAAMATVALLLQSQVGRVIVPSSYPYADLFPNGSHPLLDPLWGTESLEIVHDGCEATRLEKLAHVAESGVALRHLRVCNQQRAARNCGRCEKCLRTMVGLRLIGASDRCPTLPELDLRTLGRARLIGPTVPANWDDNLRAARDRRDWPLAAAISWARRPRPLLQMRRGVRAVRDRVRRSRRW